MCTSTVRGRCATTCPSSEVQPPAELRFTGPRPLRGRLRVPGDKGITHRALLFAALAEGRSRISGIPDGDDVAPDAPRARATRRAASEWPTATSSCRGRPPRLREPDGVVDCGNSGTTMRMLAGLVAAQPFLTVLTGDESLVTRPMARVVEPLRSMGAQIDGRDDGALAPLVIRGGTLQGTPVRARR